MKKFFDIKTIIIVVLFVAVGVLGYIWLFRGNPASNEKISQLNKENKMLQQQRDSLTKDIKMKDAIILGLQQKEQQLERELAAIEKKVKNAEANADKSQRQLTELRKELKKTRDQIKELKNNPPNRVGDDLLNSIKNKTK